MNRRCPDCDKYTNYAKHVLYCPEHGGKITVFEAPECSLCGEPRSKPIGRPDKFCIHCGGRFND